FVRGGGDWMQARVAPPVTPRLAAIQTTAGEVQAGRFVFACGPWLPRLFPDLLGRRIFPTRQEIFFFAPPAGDERFAPGRLPAPTDRQAGLPMAIGEGRSLAVTPLQAAAFVSAIATGNPVGPLAWQPAPAAGGPALAPAADLVRLRAGMRAAVAFGSAKAAASPVVPLAGKTGTSTYLDGTNRTYGWFWGYAPAEKPRLVVVVFLKDSSGFQAAAPLARQVAEAWHRAGRP
ncbi:MAG: penicillin-binding transpeptidase domain-containing protein, partial [Candidatus Sericytochromatia bacterium]